MKPPWWLVLAVIGTLGVIGHLIRMWMRRPEVPQESDLRRLFERDVASCGVSWATYEAVAAALGRAYSVHPAWLQPNEPLKKIFDVDSWDLGLGSERFDVVLASEFGITHLDTQPKTFLDLLLIVEGHKRKH